MKMSKTLIKVWFFLLLLIVAGCQNAAENLPTQAYNNTNGIKKYGEITDPAELEKLWQEYLYDAANFTGISMEFSNTKEIEPLTVARFCWSKYIIEHDAEELESDREGSYLKLFPLDVALEYARKYFDLDDIDVSEIDENIYDPQKKAFLFSPGSKKEVPRPSYNNLLRGRRLEKAVRNNDVTITAILLNPDSQKFDRIEYRDTFTLKVRRDGSLYFVKGKREYINNHLVSILGNYKYFDKITGFDGNLQTLSMLGETEGRLIFAYMPYEKGENHALMLLNPETMTIEKRLNINREFQVTDINIQGERIIIRLNDRTVSVDKTLNRSEDIMLPGAIAEKIKREPLYNEYGYPLIFFGGYDVSRDGTKYVYSDEVGLKLYNITSGSEKLLSKTVPTPDSELTNNSFHSNPRFISGDNKVITTMTGYESALGYTIYDFNKEMQKTYNIVSEGSSTGYIRYDTGLLEINNYIRAKDNQTGDYKTIYLDFATGEVKEIHLDDRGDTGYIIMPDQYYVGQNHAAFITSSYDKSDNANNKYYINSLNLKTMQAEPKIITIKAANTYILGVLADGRIIFWYDLNPSENGVCITMKE